MARSDPYQSWRRAAQLTAGTRTGVALIATSLLLNCQSHLGDLATDPQGTPDANGDGSKTADDNSQDNDKDTDSGIHTPDTDSEFPDAGLPGNGGSDSEGSGGEPNSNRGGSGGQDDATGGAEAASLGQGGRSQGGASQGGASQGGASQGGASQGGASQGGASQVGASQGGAAQGGAAQGGVGGTPEGGAGGEANANGGTGGGSAGGTGGTASAGPLTLLSSSPAAAADDVATTTDIVLTFDRDIQALSGNIGVYRSVSDERFESASMTSSRVTISGASLTFDLNGVLAGGSPYYVTLDAGAIEATDGSAFGGLNKISNLSFATALVTLPGSVANGLTLWLDAALDDSLKVSGADVTVWGDRSGNNYTVQAPLVGGEPDRISSAINGLPVVRFDGVNDYLEGPILPALAEYDVFVVWKSSILPATDRLSHLLQSGPNLEINHSHPDETFRHAGASNFETQWGAAKFSAPAVNTTYLWNLAFLNGADALVAHTNGSQTDNHTGLVENLDTEVWPLVVGAGYGQTREFTGDIGEILIYNRALDSGERSDVQNYLMSKWGL